MQTCGKEYQNIKKTNNYPIAMQTITIKLKYNGGFVLRVQTKQSTSSIP